jgi:hypothetical protein
VIAVTSGITAECFSVAPRNAGCVLTTFPRSLARNAFSACSSSNRAAAPPPEKVISQSMARMTPRPAAKKDRWPADVVAALDAGTILRVRAGAGDHRFIGIWVVVVDERVFVRSWSVKPNGWYHTFRTDPVGAIQVGGRALAVRAVPARGPRLNDAIDRAYLAKYDTPGSLKYARDLGSSKSRATTTELKPLIVRPRRKARRRREKR